MRIVTDAFLQCHVSTAELYDLDDPPQPNVFWSRESRLMHLVRQRWVPPLWLRVTATAWMLVLTMSRILMRWGPSHSRSWLAFPPRWGE